MLLLRPLSSLCYLFYIQYTPEVGIERAVPIRGTVIGRRNRGLESSFRILNANDEDVYVHCSTFPAKNPFLALARAHFIRGLPLSLVPTELVIPDLHMVSCGHAPLIVSLSHAHL